VIPHRTRFAVLALALFALAGIAVGAGIELAGRPDPVKPQLFSDWIPASTSPDVAVREIADHVQQSYTHPGDHRRLTTIAGGPLAVGSDVAKLAYPVDATHIGIRSGTTVLYTICGLAKNCAATTDARLTAQIAGALTRREAYELALRTLNASADVDNVAVILPPIDHWLLKTQAPRMLLLSRAEAAKVVTKPLDQMLPSLSRFSSASAIQVKKETDPFIYHYEVALSGSTAATRQPVFVVTPITIEDTRQLGGSATKAKA
jgi:hypothetical protein